MESPASMNVHSLRKINYRQPRWGRSCPRGAPKTWTPPPPWPPRTSPNPASNGPWWPRCRTPRDQYDTSMITEGTSTTNVPLSVLCWRLKHRHGSTDPFLEECPPFHFYGACRGWNNSLLLVCQPCGSTVLQRGSVSPSLEDGAVDGPRPDGAITRHYRVTVSLFSENEKKKLRKDEMSWGCQNMRTPPKTRCPGPQSQTEIPVR